ncbi:mannose-1-phosphate guanylyltransferase [Elizabethkingia argentiflava]|uniref:mannose-1-phosphate guanylyltransferase n=1 Tax=Elizabethkingia argenteiflava TaxID=2681556 RepID=A0A845PPV2_9FLAO|nr:mannose-1-phosphate guanylyltransferase [Elizabethkingia argenteiflava]NAW50349.1 mannose-1-phosphate guanylyltransferase [Elizabethkingia argenteiflava]
MIENRYCVIMAGGIGSRFWPISTSKFPKQFQDILGVGRTMIQQTYDRIKKVVPVQNIFVITSIEHLNIVQSQLPELNPENVVGEPVMKNTAACNIFMAMKIAQLNPDASITVLPSDHLILKENAFLKTMEIAFEATSTLHQLLTIGVKPTRPETGYGYIQFLDKKEHNVFQVKTFTEKPNLEIAKSFLESGDFLWNSGMFVWNVQDILKAFRQYLPEMHQLFVECPFNTTREKEYIEAIYPRLQKISIDNAILEKSKNVAVIPAELGWSDLGTWTSVFENAEKNEYNNVESSKYVLTYSSSGNIIKIKNKNKAVIIDGLNDYIVVDTDKALLICPRDHDQEIKDYVIDLKTMKKGDKFI